MVDYFRPLHEPAISIYDALLREAKLRNGRAPEVWLAAERETVFNEAVSVAHKMGLREPTMAEVERAEMLATGHTDYAAKWARGVAEAMYQSQATATA